MTRRSFLFASLASAAAGGGAVLPGAPAGPMPLGYNTYCLRSMNWNDAQLLQFAVDQKLDAIFLQDTRDPRAMDPAHWPQVKARAAELGLRLETGGGAILPNNPAEFTAKVEGLRTQITRAKALGSPVVRCLFAGMRSQLPPGTIEQHIETMVRLMRAVRSQVLDAGLKLAVEVHKDLQAWEFKMFLDEVGTDFVGIYLDTGNPVFVLEHPLTTIETLGPYTVTLHLRDSVVYEHPRGVAVHWVALGEGVVDFREILARARQLCPDVHVYVKPITGRPAEVIPYLEQDFWKAYPAARSKDLARFLTLAKRGVPYDKPVVNEDLLGRTMPDYLLPAIQHQQMDHMQRSLDYARESLDLGRRWRQG
jgi:sugar phosphate isomerase/epimerase